MTAPGEERRGGPGGKGGRGLEPEGRETVAAGNTGAETGYDEAGYDEAGHDETRYDYDDVVEATFPASDPPATMAAPRLKVPATFWERDRGRPRGPGSARPATKDSRDPERRGP